MPGGTCIRDIELVLLLSSFLIAVVSIAILELSWYACDVSRVLDRVLTRFEKLEEFGARLCGVLPVEKKQLRVWQWNPPNCAQCTIVFSVCQNAFLFAARLWR